MPTYSETGSGGVTTGSSAPVNVRINEQAHGGVYVGGSAIVGVINSRTSSGGANVGGSATLVTTTVGQGGAKLAGSVSPTTAYHPTPVGGAGCGGVAQHTVIIASHVGGGGLKAVRGALVETIKPLKSIQNGVGRCLNGDNLIKTMEQNAIEPTKILTPHLQTPPDRVSPFELPNNNTWCDVDERCKEGVLPAIIVRNQTPYLPPKKGTQAPPLPVTVPAP